jgi:hypothetical protein
MELREQLLADLHQPRLPGLGLTEGLVSPAYQGQSILNVPASVSNLLGAGEFGSPALRSEILDALGSGYRNVILVLVDGLGYLRLQRWLGLETFGVWRQLAERGSLTPLTSISPSTTSAALTSLWTGQPAAAHGIAGYELWLKEYGVVANMITHKPFSFEEQTGSLMHAGFAPRDFVGLPTLGEHLASGGVASHAFQHRAILNSGLSDIFFSEVQRHGFANETELWGGVRQLLETKTDEKKFVWVYWDKVDALSHMDGPDAPTVQAAFAAFSAAFHSEFASVLSQAVRQDSLLILMADHGQMATPDNPHYDLRNHPNLNRRLHIKPTGENRLAFLYVRPGQIEAVREYIERSWPRQFQLFDSHYALHEGLFGPGEAHPRMAERIGDMVVAARGSAYLWWGDKPNPLLGRHGGLTPEEMLVPFLAARLDA